MPYRQPKTGQGLSRKLIKPPVENKRSPENLKRALEARRNAALAPGSGVSGKTKTAIRKVKGK